MHLRVADLDRAVAFHENLMVFQQVARMGNWAAFLGAPMAAGDGTIYHHHNDLNTWDSRGGMPP